MPQPVTISDIPDTTGPIQTGNYQVFVREVIQRPSKKHSPMDTFKCEIISPDTDSAGAATAGREVMFYMAYTYKSLKYALEKLKKLGIDIDPAQPVSFPSEEEVKTGAYTTIPEIQELTKGLERKSFWVTLRSEPYFSKDKVTGAVLQDADGKPKVGGYQVTGDLSDVMSPATDGSVPY